MNQADKKVLEALIEQGAQKFLAEHKTVKRADSRLDHYLHYLVREQIGVVFCCETSGAIFSFLFNEKGALLHKKSKWQPQPAGLEICDPKFDEKLPKLMAKIYHKTASIKLRNCRAGITRKKNKIEALKEEIKDLQAKAKEIKKINESARKI